jgi:hypothetical protein
MAFCKFFSSFYHCALQYTCSVKELEKDMRSINLFFLRYLDPQNTEAPFSQEAVQNMPVDLYIGG